MKQLKTKEELIGKTITNVFIEDQEFWLRFSDDSFVSFEIYDIGSGYESEQGIDIDDWDTSRSSYALVKLGLVSQEEHDALIKAEDEEYQREIEKLETLRQTQQEEMERRQYEELKQKYEKG